MVKKKYLDYDLTSFSMQSNHATDGVTPGSKWFPIFKEHKPAKWLPYVQITMSDMEFGFWIWWLFCHVPRVVYVKNIEKHILVSVQLPIRLHYAYLPLDVNEVRCLSRHFVRVSQVPKCLSQGICSCYNRNLIIIIIIIIIIGGCQNLARVGKSSLHFVFY